MLILKAKSLRFCLVYVTYYTTKNSLVNELNGCLTKIGGNAKQLKFNNLLFVQFAHFFSEVLLHIAERKFSKKQIMLIFSEIACIAL